MTITMATATTTTTTFPYWFHIYRDWVKNSKGHAIGMGYKYTLKAQMPSKHYIWHQRTKTPNYSKVGSYTNTSAHKLTVLRSILERLAELLGTGQRTFQGPIPIIPAPQDIQSTQTV